MMLELGDGEIRIRFTMPKDPKKEMFDSHQLFTTVEAAEKFIVDNKNWLTDAYIIRIWEKSIAHYINGEKILH